MQKYNAESVLSGAAPSSSETFSTACPFVFSILPIKDDTAKYVGLSIC